MPQLGPGLGPGDGVTGDAEGSGSSSADVGSDDVHPEGDVPDTCGNGILDAAEDCDGLNLGDASCVSLGWEQGQLACAPGCRFDESACETCGDGERTGLEQCDGLELDGRSCSDLASGTGETFEGGELSCTSSCTYDTSNCVVCGDGVLSGTEPCDGALLADTTCESLGHTAGTLACASDCAGFDEVACSDCGDGLVTGDEQCDGDELQNESCLELGFSGGGTLVCNPTTCNFDTSGCTDNTCGDGVINGVDVCDCGESGAPCSDAQLNNTVCADLDSPISGQKFSGGELACRSPASCTEFDVSDCYYCGDGAIGMGEACDGENHGGESCLSLGYDGGGDLSCTDSCDFDESACIEIPNPIEVCRAPNLRIGYDLGDGARPNVSDSVNIVYDVPVGRVEVDFRAVHSATGDLGATMTHEDTESTLLDRPGHPAMGALGCDASNMDVTFTEGAPTAAEDTCDPIAPMGLSGDLRPTTALSAFEGARSLGTWRLDAVDHTTVTNGTITNWCVRVYW